MSKIIKASYVKTEGIPGVTRLHTVSDMLSKDTANSIYLETKIMMEEVVAVAQQKADDIIFKAKLQAQQHLDSSLNESLEIKDAAYQQGYNEGYQKGLTQAETEQKQLAKQLKGIIQQLVQEKEAMLQKQQQGVIELVIAITAKILHSLVEIKPEAICHIVKNVLERMGEAEKIVIKVNPLHIPYLGSFGEQYSGKLQVEEDSSISPGGCLVITEKGFIEANIDEQLAIIKEAMQEVIGYAGL